MYIGLTFLNGVFLAFMVAANGGLSDVYGSFLSSAISRGVGVVASVVLCMIKKEKMPRGKHIPLWLCSGGIIGVLTVVFNNLSYGKISMTSIFALSLLGQMVSSLLIDATGALGMEKRPFRATSLWGMIFSAIGFVMMIDNTLTADLIAMILSVLAGVSIVLSRILNARLSEKIGTYQSSLINHLIGIPFSAALAIIAIAGNSLPQLTAAIWNPWIYCGGVLGVVTLLICNITVPKVSSVLQTLLTLIGQILTGVLIDLLSGQDYSDASFYGGMVIAFGVAVSMVLEKMENNSPAKK